MKERRRSSSKRQDKEQQYVQKAEEEEQQQRCKNFLPTVYCCPLPTPGKRYGHGPIKQQKYVTGCRIEKRGRRGGGTGNRRPVFILDPPLYNKLRLQGHVPKARTELAVH